MLYGKEDVPQLLLDACKCQKERRILHALGRSLFDKVWTEGLHKEIEEAIQNMFNWRSELEASMNVTSETSDEDEEQKVKQGAGLTTEDSRCQNKLSDEAIAKFYMKKRDFRAMLVIDLRLTFCFHSVQNMPEYGFPPTHIFLYKDRRDDFVLIREYTGQIKPVF